MARPTSLVLAAALVALSAGGKASAQDRPQLVPLRDVAVVYRLAGADDATAETVRASYSTAGKKARLDFFGADQASIYGSTIVDQDADRVIMLIPARHGYFEQPAGPARAIAFPFDAKMQFVRGETATVAGQPCREWQVNGHGTTGTACVTEDGVLLRAVRTEPTHGTLEAVSVTYGSQPAELFAAPPGYVKLIQVPRSAFAVPPALER